MIEKEFIETDDKTQTAMSFAMQIALGVFKQILDGELSPGHHRIEYRLIPVKGDKPEPVLFIKWKGEGEIPAVFSEERLRRIICEQSPNVSEIVLLGDGDDAMLIVINKDHSKTTYVGADGSFEMFIRGLFDKEIEKSCVRMEVWNDLAEKAGNDE